jgi:hypothetical protein
VRSTLPIYGPVHRFLLVVCISALALLSTACGVSTGSASDGAPDPRELAVDAFRAAQRAGRARYSFEATLQGEGSGAMRLRVDGAVGQGKTRADVSFEGEDQSLAGTLLYSSGAVFVRYLGTWYGDTSRRGQSGMLEDELGTPESFQARFDDLFEGSVSEGPVADGVPTWAYNGRLNVDGILHLTAEEGEGLEGEARDRLEQLAETTHFTLLVGKADSLPRSVLLDLTGEGADLGGFAGPNAGKITFRLRGSFTRWGEPVTMTPPSSYAPLQEFFGQFFDL